MELLSFNLTNNAEGVDIVRTYDIIVSDQRARCPFCGKALPGRYPEDARVVSVILQCSRCKRELKVNISGSGQRR